jgi:Mn2+/Fe2+ NRAMP family transporter
VEFKGAADAFAYGAGYAAFKLLRKMSLVPGLASKVGCTKAGVEWLKEFQAWRGGSFRKPSTEKPLAFVNV